LQATTSRKPHKTKAKTKMPRLFRTLATALSLALLSLAGQAAARLPLDYAKALKLSSLFYEAQRSGAWCCPCCPCCLFLLLVT
jgi:hypothetical protein